MYASAVFTLAFAAFAAATSIKTEEVQIKDFSMTADTSNGKESVHEALQEFSFKLSGDASQDLECDKSGACGDSPYRIGITNTDETKVVLHVFHQTGDEFEVGLGGEVDLQVNCKPVGGDEHNLACTAPDTSITLTPKN